MNKNVTYNKILDLAEELIAKRGFNAFSYKDLSNLIGIKTSSIHYYFPNKINLAQKIITRCIDNTEVILSSIVTRNITAKNKINLLIDAVFNRTYKNEKRMCVGAILAVDCLILDAAIINEVKKFFELLELSIENILIEGKYEKSKQKSKFIVGAIEGTLLLSRLFDEASRFKILKDQITYIVE